MPFMSRAFTKEDDLVDHLSVRPISSDPNQVTPRGLQMIEQALEETRRAYGEAQAAGDREVLAKAGRDVRHWSVRRASAVVMPAAAGVDLERGGASMFSSRADAR
jgi:transcription elongation GreA/GreB family factor